MVDMETKERIEVNTDGGEGPYVLVPFDQVPRIRRVLRKHQIAHTLAQDVIEYDDSPAIAMIDFGRTGNAAKIQKVLDAA